MNCSFKRASRDSRSDSETEAEGKGMAGVMGGKNGGNRGRPYGLLLLLAFSAAVFGVMLLHKLRERRLFNVVINNKDKELLALHLLLQKEKGASKEAKRKIEEMKVKTVTLRNQKMELSKRLMDVQSMTVSLREEITSLEATLEEKDNKIKTLEDKTEEQHREDLQVASLKDELKQKEAEIEELRQRLGGKASVRSVSSDNPSKPLLKLTAGGGGAISQDGQLGKSAQHEEGEISAKAEANDSFGGEKQEQEQEPSSIYKILPKKRSEGGQNTGYKRDNTEPKDQIPENPSHIESVKQRSGNRVKNADEGDISSVTLDPRQADLGSSSSSGKVPRSKDVFSDVNMSNNEKEQLLATLHIRKEGKDQRVERMASRDGLPKHPLDNVNSITGEDGDNRSKFKTSKQRVTPGEESGESGQARDDALSAPSEEGEEGRGHAEIKKESQAEVSLATPLRITEVTQFQGDQSTNNSDLEMPLISLTEQGSESGADKITEGTGPAIHSTDTMQREPANTQVPDVSELARKRRHVPIPETAEDSPHSSNGYNKAKPSKHLKTSEGLGKQIEGNEEGFEQGKIEVSSNEKGELTENPHGESSKVEVESGEEVQVLVSKENGTPDREPKIQREREVMSQSRRSRHAAWKTRTGSNRFLGRSFGKDGVI